MRTTVLTLGLCVAILTVAMSDRVSSQTKLVSSDSVMFESIRDDEARLLDVIASRPGTPLAARSRNRLGYLSFKKGSLDAAERHFLLSQKENPGLPETSEADYFLGRIASSRGDQAGARSRFEAYLAREYDGPWAEGAHYFLIKGLVQFGDSAALRSISEFQRRRPGSIYAKDVQYHLVKYHEKRRDYGKALQEAKNLIASYPNSPYSADMRYQIGGLYVLLGEVDEAIAYYDTLVQRNPRNTESAAIAQCLRAETIDNSGQHQRARQEYAKVKTQSPSISNWVILSEYAAAMSLYSEATAQKDSAGLDSAAHLFTQFINQHPTDKRTPRACMTLASIYHQQGSPAEAFQALGSVVKFDQTAMTNVAPGHLAQELMAHKSLVRDAQFAQAVLLRTDLKNSLQALSVYDTLLSADPNDRQASLDKALTLDEMGRQADASSIFKSLSQIQDAIGQLASRRLRNIPQQ